MRILTVALLLFVLPVNAAELGYSLIHHRGRTDIQESARGFEFRFNVGGDVNPERYSGDRWSFALGMVQGRETTGDQWIATPAGCCAFTEEIDSFPYFSVVHRWYTKHGRFEWAPRLRLFIGTGAAWRGAETCVRAHSRATEEHCWQGTPEVSEQFVFQQSLGIKWREKIEIAIEHGSTGRLSALNLGEDMLRFSIMAFLSK